MKGKFDFRIPIIVILTVILVIMCYFYFKDTENVTNGNIKDNFNIEDNFNINDVSEFNESSNSIDVDKLSEIDETEKEKVNKTNENSGNISNKSNSNKTIVSQTSEIKSGLSEKIELHATYYFEEKYVETNQLVKSGENILKYTNGKYLTAPYDCVITELNIPEKSEKCTNVHYVAISSLNNLKVQFKVDETKIESIKLGQKATIDIDAFENKTLQGCVTNISSTASKGKFTVTVEFENDGEVLIGMTSTTTIKEN